MITDRLDLSKRPELNILMMPRDIAEGANFILQPGQYNEAMENLEKKFSREEIYEAIRLKRLSDKPFGSL